MTRSLADWVVRPRLLGVPGVSQVVIIGGEKKQFQVLVDPAKLADHGLTLEQVTEAVAAPTPMPPVAFWSARMRSF